MRQKGSNIVPVIIIALFGLGAWAYFKPKTIAQKRDAIKAYLASKGEPGLSSIIDQLTDDEITTVYQVQVDYAQKGLPPPSDTPLGTAWLAILQKYSFS